MSTDSKTGTSGNIISLPKGGGAISGIGQTFSPDLFTGTGNFSVPIAMPAGRNGFQPDVTLVYSSGNGNSVFGLGWGLSIPGVSRKTSRGIPQYDDQKDVFILSGAEDLIPVPISFLAGGTPNGLVTDHSVQFYRPRTEGLFARIAHYSDKNNDYWKVWSKDGMISYYGTPGQANTPERYNDPCVIADPEYKSKVYEWKLSKTVDVFGNVIEYRYVRDRVNRKDNHLWDMLYLEEIVYSDYLNEESEQKFFCSAKFIYETRPDPFSSYRSGFEMRTTRRCVNVELYTHPKEVAVLSKVYKLIYLDALVNIGERNADILPYNGSSILSQVQVTGYKGKPETTYFSLTGYDRDFTSADGTSQNLFNDYNQELIGGDAIRIKTNVKINGTLPDDFQLAIVSKSTPMSDYSDYENLHVVSLLPESTGDMLNVDQEYILPAGDLYWGYYLLIEKSTPNLNGVELHIPLLKLTQVVSEESMPPLEFGYTSFKPQQRDFDPIRGEALPSSALTGVYEMIDLNGNGLADIVEMNGTLPRYWSNLGNGRYGLPQIMTEAPAGLVLGEPGVQLVDADGDGRADLMVNKTGINGYFSLGYDGKWDKKAFQPYKYELSFNPADPEVRMLDLDGDGITDALRNSSRFECFFNDPKVGFYKATQTSRKSFPEISFADPRVHLSDMSGDGLQDIVLIYEGNVEYYPNLGYGRFAEKRVMSNAPRLPYKYQRERLMLGDTDGDGLSDLIYVDENKVTLWINKGGESWSDPVVITGTPSARDMSGVRLLDVYGNGMAGLLWSYDYDGTAKDRMFYLDFTGGTKPYVLNEMNNHMGAITRVEYRSSVFYYLCDRDGYDPFDSNNPLLYENRPRKSGGIERVVPQGKRIPRNPWKTTLPFPVQVVAKVEVIDELSKGKLATQYAYHHGSWDGGEREFRGFGKVVQRDTESFERYNTSSLKNASLPTGNPVAIEFDKIEKVYYTPPMETRSWFQLGPIGPEYGDWYELTFEEEYWKEDPTQLSRPKEMTAMIKGLPRRARRDAIRTLRGSMLRSEVYALDGTARQNRPYTVSESLQGVRLEYAPEGGLENYIPGYTNRQGSGYIFFSFGLGSRTTQWERGEEPMTSFSFAGDYDAYGNPLLQLGIAIPRGINPLNGAPFPGITPTQGTAFKITLAQTTLVHKNTDTKYLIGRSISSSSYEVLCSTNKSVTQLKDEIFQIATNNLPPYDGDYEVLSFNLLALTLTYYDGDAFEGLPYGQLGDYGIPVRSETLAFTDAQLDEIYGADRPLYILESGSPSWTSEYPTGFRDALPDNAGYVYHDLDDQYIVAGYYCTGNRASFDFQDDPATAKGLLLQTKDPLDHLTTIAYDTYKLLPVTVTDNLGMQVSSVIDYRTLQPKQVTDPNGNRSQVAFTPLNFVTRTAIMGKIGENVGNTLMYPDSGMEYDFFAFMNDGQPVFVKSSVHEGFINGGGTGDFSKTISGIQFSDGFGRLIQTRAQCEEIVFGDSIFGDSGLPANEDDPNAPAVGVINTDTTNINVTVSGWQIYNNKGAVVEKYEPYYDKGFTYTSPSSGIAKDALLLSKKVQMYYDPRGQVIQTINPDKSQQRVVLGIPLALDNPNVYDPTPWESYSYDANDLAEITNPDNTTVPASHYYTPSSGEIDCLGRTIRTTDRLVDSTDDDDQVIMKYSFDIRGNLLEVIDAKERTVFTHVYDLLNRNLVTTHLDAGRKLAVLDCMSRPTEARDAKGALVLSAYDELNRPVKVWCRDDSGAADTTLRTKTIFGDSVGLPDPAADNLLGKPYQIYDEAGLSEITSYDFRGLPPEKSRRVISDATLKSVFSSGWDITTFRVDWDTMDPDVILDAFAYITSMEYDALGRITKMLYPEDVDAERKILLPTYNRAGALTSIDLKDTEVSDPVNYVQRIAYNAKGQKILAAYGNGVMTRYRYDETTFRLQRMKSEGYEADTVGDTVTYEPQSGTGRQNLFYTTDLVGNIVNTYDDTTECGIAGANEMEREFEYDPLYRLLSATGRETAATAILPWEDLYRPENASLSRGYTQLYTYDKVGNIQELQHVATGGNFTRTFNYVTGKNQLDTIQIGASTYTFDHDVNGNVTSEGDDARHLEFDYGDKVKSFYVQVSTEEPSKYTQYLYDGAGTRVKKITRTQGGGFTSVTYIDGVFEHTKKDDTGLGIPYLEIGDWTIGSGDGTEEQNILHIMDGSSRIAMRRIGDDIGDTSPPIKYNLEDHLGSSILLLEADGSWVNREEYYPFGETSFGSYAKKRYRFCGKERDEESGLYYYGMRYYSAWTCRFVSVDPLAAQTPGLSPYCYANCNPVMMNDPTGGTAEGAGGGEGGDPPVSQGVDVTGDSKADIHQTVSGDTYSSIGDKYKVSIENLRYWNGYKDSGIPTGANLIVSQEGYDLAQKQMREFLGIPAPRAESNNWIKGDLNSQYDQPHLDPKDVGINNKEVDVLGMIYSSSELKTIKEGYNQAVVSYQYSIRNKGRSLLSVQGGTAPFRAAADANAWMAANVFYPTLEFVGTMALWELAVASRGGALAYRAASSSAEAGTEGAVGSDIVGTSYDDVLPTQDYINPLKVDEYKEIIKSGGKLPPSEAYRVNGRIYLEDGHHKFVANMQLGRKPPMIINNTGGPVGFPNWLKTTYQIP